MASKIETPSQSIEVEHPPHILRLLRLIREGTPSHASRASTLLGRYAASCSSGIAIHDNSSCKDSEAASKSDVSNAHPSLIIWDLIGRLVAGDGKSRGEKKGDTNSSSCSGLFDFHWETRSNCALALEAVARCLPVEDRRHFFEGCDRDGDESLLWLSVQDLQKASHKADNDDFKCNDLGNEKCSNAKSQSNQSTGDKVELYPKNQMDTVVERGRLLLASSGERYDWTCEDEEAQAYIRENQALQSLDGGAGPEDNVDQTKQSFLRRRVLLQRQILARRIGLGGILSSAIVNTDGNTTQHDIANDEDFISDITSAEATGNKRKATKQSGKKGGKASTKRKRKSRKKDQDEEDEFLPTIDIRQLLIAESNRSITSNDLNDKAHNSKHRNPQLLLSTEVAYRTFDPQWTVRHGALLATLSLLRAWRVHDVHRAFGQWPDDILARCICIIGLDRFADFSGTDIGAAGSLDDVMSGAAVAPVREMAAQIIAILLEAAPSEMWDCTFNLLFQLFHRRCDSERDGWEVRHGVLLVLKYVCALAQLHSTTLTEISSTDPILRPLSRRSATSRLNGHHDTFDNIIKLSVQGLTDNSDDVRAVSAQVLLQMLRLEQTHYTIDIVKDCTSSIWDALCTPSNDLSPSASDLLTLFSTLLTIKFNSVITALQSRSTETEKEASSAIVDKLASFIGFDSEVVRISCFRALSLVSGSMAGDADHSNTLSATRILCNVVDRLFYHLCGHSSHGSMTDAVSKHWNQAWDSIIKSLATLSNRTNFDDGCQKIVQDTAVTITLRYFGVCKQNILPSSKTSIEVMFRGIERNPNGPERSITTSASSTFVTQIGSATALAQFYKMMCPTKLYPMTSLAIQTCIRSPWLYQCESSCLLFCAVASVDENVDVGALWEFMPALFELTNFESKRLPCISIDMSSSGSSLLRDTKIQSLCDNAFLALLTSASSSQSNANHNSLSDNIVSLWQSVFKEKRVIFNAPTKPQSCAPTKPCIRLNALIAGALIHTGFSHWPKKITPIIQAFVTSLKNEDCEARAKQTCCYIARMIAMVPDDSAHIRARDKLLENLCYMASHQCSDHLVPLQSIWAHQTLELIIAGLSAEQKLRKFSSIWNKMSLLTDSNYSDLSEQQQLDSVLMLNIVTKALSGGNTSISSVVLPFAKPAVEISCNNTSVSVRGQASESILNMCSIDLEATMDVAISSLLPILADLENDQVREGGCELLLSIMQKFSVSMGPYLVTLLPVVMRLMTDASEDCSRNAASAFAILVRIAPLSTNYMDQSTYPLSSKVSEDVIRHLVLGKPLPPCKLPEKILKALEESGTILRPYQMEGISWMRFLSEVHLNGALCDDMGLGKTLQSLVTIGLSHCTESASPKRSLVVCPSTLVGHWVKEIRRFFPNNQVLSSFDFTGPAKARRKSWSDEAHHHNIVVTSYSVLRSDIDLLETVVWDYCILDEGHLLKNPKTITAKASRRIKAHHKLILTGTPIQNHVHEIWATFDFLMPNFLGSESNFIQEFAKPIVNGQKLEASASEMNRGMDCLKVLHQQVLPFVLRREKGQVMKELPPKIITDIPCALSSQQEVLYKQVMEKSQTKAALDLVEKTISNSSDMIAPDEQQQKLGSNVLASLLQLRLICTHPALHSLLASKKQMPMITTISKLDISGKLMALNDLMRHSGIAGPEITAADNDTSGFLLAASDKLIGSDNGDDLFVDESCIGDNIDQEVAEGTSAEQQSKCLIFAQFTQSLDVVEKFLFEPHMPSLEYLRLDGSVPSNQRSAIVDRFNEDASIKVLLLTTKVGGLGLNLTGADTVIFLEPDWNPFTDLQAMDRAHRIGQTKTVNVYRLITADTIEEKILKLQDRKRATAEAVVNTDNSTMYSMGTDKLLDVFTFRGPNASNERDDDVLSYLDEANSNEYASLSVSGFLGGLK